MSDGPLQGWHVRKDVNIGHIVTTIAMIIAATMGYAEVKSNQADHERRIAIIEARAENDDTAERLAAIEAILLRLEAQVGRQGID